MHVAIYALFRRKMAATRGSGLMNQVPAGTWVFLRMMAIASLGVPGFMDSLLLKLHR